jgi:HPt (histidine-containing phosphotransfer) domain-containing protein
LRLFGGDEADYIRVLQGLQRRLREEHVKLVDYLRNADREAALYAAHALKGVAGNAAAVRLEELSVKIEETLKAEAEVDAALIDEMEGALQEAGQGLDQIQVAVVEGQSADTVGTAEAAGQLRAKLAASEWVDTETLEQALAYLRSLGLNGDELQAEVENMAFDEALEILDSLLEGTSNSLPRAN